jgi:hypothetical protein
MKCIIPICLKFVFTSTNWKSERGTAIIFWTHKHTHISPNMSFPDMWLRGQWINFLYPLFVEAREVNHFLLGPFCLVTLHSISHKAAQLTCAGLPDAWKVRSTIIEMAKFGITDMDALQEPRMRGICSLMSSHRNTSLLVLVTSTTYLVVGFTAKKSQR